MKVFGVGLSRTGTNSLHAAAVLMGLSAYHNPLPLVSRWFSGDFSPATTEPFDMLSDQPMGLYFKQLDASHPGARFILTIRELEVWLDSIEAHYARSHPPSPGFRSRDLIRLATYGVTVFHRDTMRDAFERHLDDVLHHFRHRPSDLLVLDVTKSGDPWQALSNFLGLNRPEGPFPHVRQPHMGELNAVHPWELADKQAKMRRFLSSE